MANLRIFNPDAPPIDPSPTVSQPIEPLAGLTVSKDAKMTAQGNRREVFETEFREAKNAKRVECVLDTSSRESFIVSRGKVGKFEITLEKGAASLENDPQRIRLFVGDDKPIRVEFSAHGEILAASVGGRRSTALKPIEHLIDSAISRRLEQYVMEAVHGDDVPRSIIR